VQDVDRPQLDLDGLADRQVQLLRGDEDVIAAVRVVGIDAEVRLAAVVRRLGSENVGEGRRVTP